MYKMYGNTNTPQTADTDQFIARQESKNWLTFTMSASGL